METFFETEVKTFKPQQNGATIGPAVSKLPQELAQAISQAGAQVETYWSVPGCSYNLRFFGTIQDPEAILKIDTILRALGWECQTHLAFKGEQVMRVLEETVPLVQRVTQQQGQRQPQTAGARS